MNLRTAQQIASTAPSGTMLAPPTFYGVIPMVDGFHPQIRTRDDGDRLWLTKNEGIMREKASQFASGNVNFIKEFSELLRENIVQTIVLKNTIFSSPLGKRTQNILQSNGFMHQKQIGGYLIVWK